MRRTGYYAHTAGLATEHIGGRYQPFLYFFPLFDFDSINKEYRLKSEECTVFLKFNPQGFVLDVFNEAEDEVIATLWQEWNDVLPESNQSKTRRDEPKW